MSDNFFGAPYGLIAAQELQNATLKNSVDVQETLGRIAMQPVEMSLKTAQAREQNALAVGREQTLRTEQAMLELQGQFGAAQRQGLIQQRASAGLPATIEDLGTDGLPVTQTDALQQFADFAANKGVPPLMVAKIQEQIGKQRVQEASAAHNAAQAANQQMETKIKRAEQISNIAGSAALSPANFNAIMMGEDAKLLPPELPRDYRSALPTLLALRDEGVKQADRMRIGLEATNIKSKDALRASQQAVTVQQAELLKVKVKAAEEDRDRRIKYEGATSAAARDASKSLTEKRNREAAQKSLIMNPLVPLDPKLWKIDQSYTGKGGQIASYGGVDAAGNYIWRKVEQTKLPPLSEPEAAPADELYPTAPVEE